MKVVLQNLTKIFPSRNKKSHETVVAVSDFSFTTRRQAHCLPRPLRMRKSS